MRRWTSKDLVMLGALMTAFFVATRMASSHHAQSTPLEYPALAIEADSPAPSPATDDEAAPGGMEVVYAGFALVGALVVWVSAFIFPPAYVASGIVFGAVSLLGILTLVVHFRSR